MDGTRIDYIAEQGTSGIWTYRKWHNGVSECWGEYSHSATISAAWGVLFTSGTTFMSAGIKLPTGLFIETPKFIVTPKTGDVNFWLSTRSESGQGSATITPAYQLLRPNAYETQLNAKVDFYIIGKWK